MRYQGEGFVVDTDAFTVERDEQPVDLEPQAMDLLVFMLERRGQLLTKADLIDNVWQDSFVGESALTTRIKQVRSALGDDGRAQRLIKTVHGRGYTFIGDVDEVGAVSAAQSAPTGPDRHRVRHNLPPARTQLIGRGRLIDEVEKVIAAERLTTLVGFGGAGKTSVALEAGRRAVVESGSPPPSHGVWFVDLIPVKDADGIDSAVARALGLQLGSDADRAELLTVLSARELLIVLDNCEHVIDEAAAFCTELLDHAPSVHLLATSREPLRVVGEYRIPVEPLPVVDAEGGAIDLLEAVARRSGASIADDERPAAIDLCRRVDGLPLAIELVGARLAHLSVAEVTERLERVAKGVSTDRRPDRHTSLATVLAATVGGLSDDARHLLTVLSRLEGPFAIDDAESIIDRCDLIDPDSAFAELLDRSLLAVSREIGLRYRVLETVRQHMAAQDPQSRTTDLTYADWCRAALGESVQRHFYDLRQATWVRIRYDDIVNAAAIYVAVGRYDDAAMVASGTALAMHLDDGARAAQMLRVMESCIDNVDDPVLLAHLHSAGVMAAMAAREHMGMFEHGQAGVAHADETDDHSLRGLARVLRSWGGVVVDARQAIEDVDDAIDIARHIGDTDTEIMAVGYKSFHLAMSLRFDEAVATARNTYNDDIDHLSYPQRVAATGLMCTLVLDEPATTIAVDAKVRDGMTSAGFWGSAIVRACAHAALGNTEAAVAGLDDLDARLDQAGVDGLPDLLLIPSVIAHTLDDVDRAAQYLGAVRAAPKPTQSLMVSTAYRVLRNHITVAPAEQIEGDTEAVWADARAWLADLPA